LAYTLIGAIGIILIHAATGVCIGYGVYIYSLTKYLLFAIVLYIPVTGLTYISAFLEKVYLQLLILPYGLILYWYFTTQIMVKIKIKKEEKKNEKGEKSNGKK
jgi:hypothetical protein